MCGEQLTVAFTHLHTHTPHKNAGTRTIFSHIPVHTPHPPPTKRRYKKGKICAGEVGQYEGYVQNLRALAADGETTPGFQRTEVCMYVD